MAEKSLPRPGMSMTTPHECSFILPKVRLSSLPVFFEGDRRKKEKKWVSVGKFRGDISPGFTIVEIMVAIGLLAVTVIFMAGAIVQSQRSFSHARQIQAVTSYAKGLLEDTNASPPPKSELPETDLDTILVVGAKECHISRSIYLIESEAEYSSIRVVVSVDWDTCPKPLMFSQLMVIR
jgi:hypothetical protein